MTNYQMPVLTDEDKKLAENLITCNYTPSVIDLFKVALASLKSESCAEIKCHEDLTLHVVNVNDGFSLGRHKVYTAPPVPALKLPDAIEPEDVPGIIDSTANPDEYACCVGMDV